MQGNLVLHIHAAEANRNAGMTDRGAGYIVYSHWDNRRSFIYCGVEATAIQGLSIHLQAEQLHLLPKEADRRNRGVDR